MPRLFCGIAALSAPQGWGALDASWTLGIGLIALTIALHAVGVVAIALPLLRLHIEEERPATRFFRTFIGGVVTIVVVGIGLVALQGIECGIWAFAYVRLGALPSPADALLYSVDSMTTRGASGLTLAHRWLMMGALEAMNGMMLFGISAALLIGLMQRILPVAFRRSTPRNHTR